MPYKAISGIYKIQSISYPERVYIGSAINIKDRWSRHKRALIKNKHENIILQRHYNKYGAEDLEFEVIESGDYLCKNHLLSREQGWYIPFKCGNKEVPFFNISLIAGSPLGIKRSEETKRKVGLASKGRPSGKKGIPVSEETRQLLREAHLGKKASEETRAKMRESRKNPSLESREKSRKSHMGLKHSEEAKEKIRKWNIDRPPFTEEHKENISIALLKSEKHKNRKRNKLGQYE